MPTGYGSALYDGHRPAWDAACVALARAAGAIVMGKTTTMEYAMGVPDPTKPFPVPRNPWDASAWAGGSSSGSASGVAAGLFFASLGTDTGGSIRLPAAFCGVTGMVPTYGRISVEGSIPFAPSMDRVGWFARDARDCSLVFDAIAGAGVDSTAALPSIDDDAPLQGQRIGIVSSAQLGSAQTSRRAAAIGDVGNVFTGLGAEVQIVTLPDYAEVTEAALVTACRDAYARHRTRLETHESDYFESTRAFLHAGAEVPDELYAEMQARRAVASAAIAARFEDVDCIVMPVASVGAPPVDSFSLEAMGALASEVHTPYWNALANPLVCGPMGTTDAGLPLGMQLAGRPHEEARLLRILAAFQDHTDHHHRGAAGDEDEPM
jgi:aspartyl-tRNA(Asn)/glutamyl-tRNA(Gln) amidotransferase subunit A